MGTVIVQQVDGPWSVTGNARRLAAVYVADTDDTHTPWYAELADAHDMSQDMGSVAVRRVLGFTSYIEMPTRTVRTVEEWDALLRRGRLAAETRKARALRADADSASTEELEAASAILATIGAGS